MAATPGRGGLVSLGQVDVAAAGTPVSILANFTGLDTQAERVTAKWSGKCSAVLVQSLSTNTGIVYIGNRADMDPTAGGDNGVILELAVGASATIGSGDSMNLLNMGDLYIDAATSGDDVRVSAIIL